MKALLILFCSMLIVSCASIINNPYTSTKIHTTEPSEIKINNNVIKTENNIAILPLERSKEPLLLKIITDSLEKEITIKSKYSFWFFSNIIFNEAMGMLVDLTNNKRYTYPKNIYINSSDTLNTYYGHSKSDNKGDLTLNISLPHINTFLMKPNNEPTKNTLGFWGLSLGMDYHYKNNNYINISATVVNDFFIISDLLGDREIMSSFYFSASHNHRIKRFSLGYGLSYSINNWHNRYSLDYEENDTKDKWKNRFVEHEGNGYASENKCSSSIGFIFPAYMQLGNSFNLGLIYRPSFLNLNSLARRFSYQHTISLDLAWKIKLNKRRI